MGVFWIFGAFPLFFTAVLIIEYFSNQAQNPENAIWISTIGYGAVAAFVGWVAYYMGRDNGRDEERNRWRYRA